MCFENGLPRQSADWLAMTGFSTALPLPLGEVAERSEDGEGKQKRTALRRFFQLVDKPSLCGKQFLYAGGARGGKARLELDQMSRKALPCKACVERSDYFRAARRHKNNDIISGCRKSRRLFRQPETDRPAVCFFTPALISHLAVSPAAPAAHCLYSQCRGCAPPGSNGSSPPPAPPPRRRRGIRPARPARG